MERGGFDTRHVVLLLDGMSGPRSTALGEREPLAVARTPNLDALVAEGRAAAIEAPAGGRPMGRSDLLAALVGRDPGLAGLSCARLIDRGSDLVRPGSDAASGIAPSMCLDLLAIEHDRIVRTGDHGLTMEEGQAIFADVLGGQPGEGDGRIGAFRVTGWRCVAPHRAIVDLDGAVGFDGLETCTPSAGLGQPIASSLPSGEGSRAIRQWITAASATLAEHDVLVTRREAGMAVSTHVWPWGTGTGADGGLAGAVGRYDARPVAMVACDAISRGFGRELGAESIDVSRDPASFVAATVRASRPGQLTLAAWSADAVSGDVDGGPEDDARRADERVAAIEAIDERIVGPVAASLGGASTTGIDHWRLLVVAGPSRDPATGARLAGPCPAVFAGHGFRGRLTMPFEASLADLAELRFRPGDDVVEFLLYGAGVRRPHTPRRPRRRRPENGRA